MAPKPRKIEPGDRFGCWTVVEELKPVPLGERMRRRMRVVCDCGEERQVLLQKLSSGQSIGCRKCFNVRRRSVFLTHQGVTMSQQEWAQRLGISRNTIYDRRKKGYPVELVLHPGSVAELRKANAA